MKQCFCWYDFYERIQFFPPQYKGSTMCFAFYKGKFWILQVVGIQKPAVVLTQVLTDRVHITLIDLWFADRSQGRAVGDQEVFKEEDIGF